MRPQATFSRPVQHFEGADDAPHRFRYASGLRAVLRERKLIADRASNQLQQRLEVGMQVFPARFGASSSRLELRAFKLDVQRVHEAVHQAAESRNRRELDDFSRIEILRQLPKGLVVVASLVPRDQLGPPDDGFLTVPEKRTLQVVAAG